MKFAQPRRGTVKPGQLCRVIAPIGPIFLYKNPETSFVGGEKVSDGDLVIFLESSEGHGHTFMKVLSRVGVGWLFLYEIFPVS